MFGPWGELKVRLMALLAMVLAAGSMQTQVAGAHTGVPVLPTAAPTVVQQEATAAALAVPGGGTAMPASPPAAATAQDIPPSADPAPMPTWRCRCGMPAWPKYHVACPLDGGVHYVCRDPQ